MSEDKRRNKDAWKLPRRNDRDYGPYGQQRPEKRPKADDSEEYAQDKSGN